MHERSDQPLELENARLRRELGETSAAAEARLAEIAHDLRNPLNAFATSLALLDALLGEPEGTVRRTLNAMDRSVQEMHHLVETLVEAPPTFGRPVDSAPPRPVLVGCACAEDH